MAVNDAISTAPIIEKLKNLSEHMPGEDEFVYKFGAFLAGRLNPGIVPQGFVIAAQLALFDIQQGVDGFTGEQISRELHGYPPQMYAFLDALIPQIAKAVCPEDFTRGVEEFLVSM